MFSLSTSKENAHDEGLWTCLWASRTAEMIERFKSEASQENSQEAYLQNGDLRPPLDILITGGVGDTVKIWQISLSKADVFSLMHDLVDHSLGVVSVAVNSSVTKVACSSLDASIHIWDVDSGERLCTYENSPRDVWTISFDSSMNNSHIICGSGHGKIVAYSVATGAKICSLETRSKFILSVAYSPNNEFIAGGAIDGLVYIYDVHNNDGSESGLDGKLKHTLEAHAMPVRCVAFSSSSRRLATCSDDSFVKVYDVKQGKLLSTLGGHKSWVLGVSFRPSPCESKNVADNEDQIVSCSVDQTVRIWSISSSSCLHVFSHHTNSVWAIAFSPEGNHLLSVGEDKTMNVYSMPS